MFTGWPCSRGAAAVLPAAVADGVVIEAQAGDGGGALPGKVDVEANGELLAGVEVTVPANAQVQSIE